MKFPQPYTLKQIADILQIEFVGEPDALIRGCNEIHRVEIGDIVFVDHPKYYDKALQSAATTVLINKKVDCPKGKSLLISEDPFSDFNKLSQFFKPFTSAEALIAPTAKIGKNTTIQPGVFVGNNVIIGDNCVIHSNVSIYDNCIIGNNVIIHANTVLGGDAFYYKNRPTGFDKLLSTGNVVIEDDVELGASCTIDKGVSSSTLIKKGTKFDSQVHVGHDTIVGEKCLIGAQTGLAGCVVVEDEVTIWGHVAVTSDVTISKGAVVLAKSGVTKSLEGDKNYFGVPAKDVKKLYREMAAVRQLPELIKKIKSLK